MNEIQRRVELRVVDAKAERVIGDADANQLLTRHYRQGFAVPDKA
jgi:hypothetical protein